MAPDCPDCGGTGFRIQTTPEGTSSATRCDCSYREQAGRALKTARIPPRYNECIFEHFYPKDSHQEALKVALEWVERWPDLDFGHSLLFNGPPGTGKTHLSIAIIL